MASPAAFAAVRALLGGSLVRPDGPTVPLAWPNEPFDKPEPPAPWVLVEMSGHLLEAIEIGAASSNTWAEQGQVWCHCFVPSASGSDTARAVLKALSDLFRANNPYRFVVFRAQSIGLGAPGDDDGAWWRLSMSVDWLYADH